MPAPEDDVTRDSSTAAPEAETQEVGTAANDTKPDTKAPEAAATEPSTSDNVEPKDTIDSKTAIEFLVGKKIDKTKADEKPKETAPKETEKKSDEKTTDDPYEGYSEQERKVLGRKTHKRIQDLHRRATTAETELQQHKPRSEAFGSIVEKHQLQSDLGFIADDQVAGTIKFQAAIARAFNKQATREDAAYIHQQFAELDKVREAFGIAPPGGAQTNIASDLESAIASLRKDFDFGPLEKLLEQAKSGTAKRQTQTVETRQPEQAPAETQPAVQNPDVKAYSTMLARDLSKDGVEKPQDYMAKELWPLISKELQADYPGANPVNVYTSLSARAQYDIATRAHSEARSKSAALKSTERAPTRPTTKPVTTGRTASIGEAPTASGSRAAINFLTGK